MIIDKQVLQRFVELDKKYVSIRVTSYCDPDWLSSQKKTSNAEPDQITPKDVLGKLQGEVHFIADY